MEIEYRNSLPSKEDFFRLFTTTGWNREYQLSPERLQKAISASWCTISAYADERLVGFGRVVSDGAFHAIIYDLIADPEFQRRGIGSHMLGMLVSRCRESGIKDIQLFCARGKRSFYERNGFVARSDDAPGMEYESTEPLPESDRDDGRPDVKA
ncbi:MAG TPA: GNAT family N-acetyltransferase [Bacteroidota bacterium]|nr:GNAT family N-acetyltransferase [Bacteroidota bacterium]